MSRPRLHVINFPAAQAPRAPIPISTLLVALGLILRATWGNHYMDLTKRVDEAITFISGHVGLHVRMWPARQQPGEGMRSRVAEISMFDGFSE